MFGMGKTPRQRAEAEVEKRRSDPKTYTEPLDYSSDPKMKEFLMDFYKNVLFKKQDEMKALLDQHPKTIGKYYKQLVPSQMENEDFWQRYYYRVRSVDELLEEWGEAPSASEGEDAGGGGAAMLSGGGSLDESEPDVPNSKKDRTHSTMELLSAAEDRIHSLPVGMPDASAMEATIEEEVEEDDDEEEAKDEFKDAQEDVKSSSKDDKERKSSSSRGDRERGDRDRDRDRDRRKKSSRSRKSSGDDDDSDDSEGSARSFKSAYSYRSTRSSRSTARSVKSSAGDRKLSPAREMRRQRSRKRFEEKRKKKEDKDKDKDDDKEGGGLSRRARGLAGAKGDSFGSEKSFRRRQGHVLDSMEASFSAGLSSLQKKSKDRDDSMKKKSDSKSDILKMEPEEGGDSSSAFPTKSEYSESLGVAGEEAAPDKRGSDKSFFGRIAKTYDPADPEKSLSQEDKRKALGIGTSTPLPRPPEEPRKFHKWSDADDTKRAYSRRNRRFMAHSDKREETCWDICFYIFLSLTLVVVGFTIYLILQPDQAISMGDGMCAPIAPYQTLTTDKGKIGVAPWWVWPPRNKAGVFAMMCGEDRLRTMLVWAPKHKHEKDFRLVIGDIDEEETVLRLNGLEEVRIFPQEMQLKQSEEALDEEDATEFPEFINAAWISGWDEKDQEEMEDLQEERRR